MVKHCVWNSLMIQNQVLEGVVVVVSAVVAHHHGGEGTPQDVAGIMIWTVTQIAIHITTGDLTLTTDAEETILIMTAPLLEIMIVPLLEIMIVPLPEIMIARLPEIIMTIHLPEITMTAHLLEITSAHLPGIMIAHLPEIIMIEHLLEIMIDPLHPGITMIDPHLVILFMIVLLPVTMMITENPQPHMMTATLPHNQDDVQWLT